MLSKVDLVVVLVSSVIHAAWYLEISCIFSVWFVSLDIVVSSYTVVSSGMVVSEIHYHLMSEGVVMGQMNGPVCLGGPWWG